MANKPSFQELVAKELTFGRVNNPSPLNSSHEALAVLWEEFEELKDEVFKKRALRDEVAMLAELVQVAAVCQRMAEDLRLIEHAHHDGCIVDGRVKPIGKAVSIPT